MLLNSPKPRLITFFKTRLIKFYLNNQLMTDPVLPSVCLKTSTHVSLSKDFEPGQSV